MGDRANVVVCDTWPGSRNHAPAVTSHEAVFLYSHWGGYDMPQNLRDALADAEDRWDDSAYLARILHNALKPSGISTRLTDNEYDLLVLLPHEKRLVRIPEDAYRTEHGLSPEGHPSISFADYTSYAERTWDNLTDVPAVASPRNEETK